MYNMNNYIFSFTKIFARTSFINSNSKIVQILTTAIIINTVFGIIGIESSFATDGVNTIIAWSSKVATIHITIGLFENSPILNTDFLSDLHIYANNISIVDNVINTEPTATLCP